MGYRDDPPELEAPRRGAYLPLLDRVTVKTACRQTWDAMVGDDRVRHCKTCDQQVYNVIAMTTAEIEQLIAGSDRTCARLHRRPDGTIITADCVGARSRARIWATRAVALGAVLAGTGAMVALATAGAETVDVDGWARMVRDGQRVHARGPLPPDPPPPLERVRAAPERAPRPLVDVETGLIEP